MALPKVLNFLTTTNPLKDSLFNESDEVMNNPPPAFNFVIDYLGNFIVTAAGDNVITAD